MTIIRNNLARPAGWQRSWWTLGKATATALLLVIVVISGLYGQARRGKDWVFQPARYKGLVVGRASRADAWRVLGKPTYSVRREDDPLSLEDGYERPGYFPFPYHRVVLIVDSATNRIYRVEVHCKRELSLSDLSSEFGSEWRRTRWDYDRCLATSEEDSGPLFESPAGSVVYWENRPLGLAYSDESMTLEYLEKPIGPAVSRCKGPGRRR
jgi:hypothetical protein